MVACSGLVGAESMKITTETKVDNLIGYCCNTHGLRLLSRKNKFPGPFYEGILWAQFLCIT